MRTIRVFEHVSLDGLIAPDGVDSEYVNGGWTAPYRTPAGAAMLSQMYGERFDLLLGRRTYDVWAGFWPRVEGGPFAAKLNGARKYVVTHRPGDLPWGPAERLEGNLAEELKKIQADSGPDLIVCGSGTVTAALLDQGLVDELVLCVYPVVLGGGTRFAGRTPLSLRLTSSQATPTGVLVNVYSRTNGR